MPRYFSGRMSLLHGEGRQFESVTRYHASLVQRIELESSKLRMVVRFHHGAPKLMESNAAGMVLRPALKTGFSEMGWGSTPLLSAKL